jgi:hypothetical protein
MKTLAILRLALPLAVMASEDGMSSGGVDVRILGQSGKMTLTSLEYDVDVTIAMDSLYELDADGNSIGGGGPPSGKHSLQSFAPQDFTIDSTPTRDEIDGIAVDKINFETSLVEDAASFKVALHRAQCHATHAGHEAAREAVGSYRMPRAVRRSLHGSFLAVEPSNQRRRTAGMWAMAQSSSQWQSRTGPFALEKEEIHVKARLANFSSSPSR